MQEMNEQEVDVVGTGLSADAGGIAITMLGIIAIGAASPVLGVTAVGVGLGLLIYNAF